MTDYVWQKGQKAVIDRRQVVMIDRVTPNGRARVGDRMFGIDGHERVRDSWRHSYLEPLTPELEEIMARVERGRKLSNILLSAIKKLEHFEHQSFGGVFDRGVKVPEAKVLEKAERLITAILAEIES